MKSLPAIALGLGVSMLVASLVWGLLFPAKRGWTEEKSARMSELGTKAHALGGQLDSARRRPSMHGKSAAELETEYNGVTAELTKLRVEFESRRDSPKNASIMLRWAGIAFVVAGGLVVFAKRS